MPKRRHWLSGAFNRASPPPPAPRSATADSYHGQDIADPFRPLEELRAAETLRWVKAQQARFHAFLKSGPSPLETAAYLRSIWAHPHEGTTEKYGKNRFRTHGEHLARHPVYEVRRRSKGEGRVLIDPNRLAKDRSVSLKATYPSPDGTLLAYILSRAGSDEESLHIMNVETGQELPETITGLRFSAVSWDDNDDGDDDNDPSFTYLTPGPNGLHNIIVRRHVVGEDPANDALVFGPEETDGFASHVSLDDGHEWFSWNRQSTGHNALWMRPEDSTRPFREMFNVAAGINPVGERGGRIYMITSYGAPRGRLVSFNPRHPGPEHWRTVIPEPSYPDVLTDAYIEKNRIFATFSHDTAEQVRIYTLRGRHLQDIPVPPHSTCAVKGRNSRDEMRLSVSGFQKTDETYRFNEKKKTLKRSREGGYAPDLEGCIIERIQATSKDGTKIPMTVIRHPDTKLDGTAAVKLYGYGGFNQALGPEYDPDIVNWIHAGGIYVKANLRGGGEFGSDWYDQGRGRNKQNTFDDFAACAAHLSKRHYTSPQRLVISGASNGGLVVLATMLQRPELFGAVVADVPVTDMLRFHRHSYGSFWKSDYGDIDGNVADFDAARRYSPLHNVQEGRKYPPTLVMTGDHDDRVVPSHAYKFVAEMQDKAHPDTICLLRTEKNAGHAGPLTASKKIRRLAEVHAFITQAIGPIAQADYIAALEARAEPRRKNATGRKPGP